MRSLIDPNIIDQLITDAQKDGIGKLVVGAIIRKEGGFLLLERVGDDFMGGLVELPSGVVDENEHVLSALFREVFEETGLSISSVLAYIGSFDYVSGSGKQARQFNFLVETESGEVVLEPKEHQSYYFTIPSKASFQKLNISKATKSIIEKVASS